MNCAINQGIISLFVRFFKRIEEFIYEEVSMEQNKMIS